MEIQTVAEEGMMPERQHAWDAGADLKAAKTMEVEPGEAAMVPTGVRCAIPEGYVGLLFARSSLCRKNIAMANGVGVIDSGYAGEIVVPLVATDQVGSQVGRGERIAQLVVVPCMLPTFDAAESLPETERGEGGFGSTGIGVVAENATAGEPKCLDADGVEIKAGDEVYVASAARTDYGSAWTVKNLLEYRGELGLTCENEHGCLWLFAVPSLFAHRKPDSWEKLRDDMRDAIEDTCSYLNPDAKGCGLCEVQDCLCEAYAADKLVARAKRLAGVDDE